LARGNQNWRDHRAGNLRDLLMSEVAPEVTFSATKTFSFSATLTAHRHGDFGGVFGACHRQLIRRSGQAHHQTQRPTGVDDRAFVDRIVPAAR